jgi:hypothetical protein
MNSIILGADVGGGGVVVTPVVGGVSAELFRNSRPLQVATRERARSDVARRRLESSSSFRRHCKRRPPSGQTASPCRRLGGRHQSAARQHNRLLNDASGRPAAGVNTLPHCLIKSIHHQACRLQRSARLGAALVRPPPDPFTCLSRAPPEICARRDCIRDSQNNPQQLSLRRRASKTSASVLLAAATTNIVVELILLALECVCCCVGGGVCFSCFVPFRERRARRESAARPAPPSPAVDWQQGELAQHRHHFSRRAPIPVNLRRRPRRNRARALRACVCVVSAETINTC